MNLYSFNVYSAIRRCARVHGNQVGWSCGSRRITHLEFLKNVDTLANGLGNTGIRKGDRIGIVAQNSLEFFYLYGACAKIGATVLPVNWRLTGREIEYVIVDGSPKVLFVAPMFQDVITPIMASFGSVEKFYSLGPGRTNYQAFLDLMKNNEAGVEPIIDPQDPYIIIYTAAVDGIPRGAILSQECIISSNLQLIRSLNLSPEDRNLCMLPLFHIGEIAISLSVMQAGGVNVVLPKFDAQLAVKHIQKDKTNIFLEFPPMLEKLLDHAEDGNSDLTNIKKVIGLDLPDTIKRFEEVTGGTFWSGYGQSETTGIICLAPYSARPGSAGLPGLLTEIEIMDNDGNIIEEDRSGEIVVRGPTVFKGYWNLEKDNEYVFRGGWHHTGDIGYIDNDGYLWYRGRMPDKDLIKSGGENVYPLEVERIIMQHPGISKCIVFGVPDPQWKEGIKAVCQLKEGISLEPQELIDFVGKRIARYKKPHYVEFVNHIPSFMNGSIDRKRVKEVYGARK